ncbi:MAG TPA: HD domain-containing protein [Bacillota bacterium]|nr:HD domain-containing protein [Bacillota bacterium]
MTLLPKQILQRLVKAGYAAYYVGGCVRDHLLGLAASDIDLATAAIPSQIAALFPDAKLNAVGKQYGVLLVDGIEVATFRGEAYLDPGKPLVYAVSNFVTDAARRDFTINAIAMDENENLLDPFGGRQDILERHVRAVGKPKLRFEEDPIRIVRAVTFAARFDFTLEENTKKAMIQCADLLDGVPQERIGKELHKMVNKRVLYKGLSMLADCNLLYKVLPQMCHLGAVSQNPAYHHLNAWEHTLAVLAYVETKIPQDEVLTWAAMFHDCAKGLPGIRSIDLLSSQPSDHGHEVLGCRICEQSMLGWEVAKAVRKQVSKLITWHMSLPMEFTPIAVVAYLRHMSVEFKDIDELNAFIKQLYLLKTADIMGKSPDQCELRLSELNTGWSMIDYALEIIPFYLIQAGIHGNGRVEKGPELGAKLQQLLMRAQTEALGRW